MGKKGIFTDTAVRRTGTRGRQERERKRETRGERTREERASVRGEGEDSKALVATSARRGRKGEGAFEAARKVGQEESRGGNADVSEREREEKERPFLEDFSSEFFACTRSP